MRPAVTINLILTPTGNEPCVCKDVLGLRVDATSYEDASRSIRDWAAAGESRYVCVANVHMTMEAYDREEYRRLVNAADLVTPDGMPLVWALRWLGRGGERPVYGP